MSTKFVVMSNLYDNNDRLQSYFIMAVFEYLSEAEKYLDQFLTDKLGVPENKRNFVIGTEFLYLRKPLRTAEIRVVY